MMMDEGFRMLISLSFNGNKMGVIIGQKITTIKLQQFFRPSVHYKTTIIHLKHKRGFEPPADETIFVHHYFGKHGLQNFWKETLTCNCCMCCNQTTGRVNVMGWLACKTQFHGLDVDVVWHSG